MNNSKISRPMESWPIEANDIAALQGKFDMTYAQFLNRKNDDGSYQVVQVFTVHRTKPKLSGAVYFSMITVWYEQYEFKFKTLSDKTHENTEDEAYGILDMPLIKESVLISDGDTEQTAPPANNTPSAETPAPETTVVVSDEPLRYTKIAVTVYHKNSMHYPSDWIHACMQSLGSQTRKDFQMFELNYGDPEREQGRIIVNDDLFERTVLSYAQPHDNHVGAQNWLFDKVTELGYEVIFNVNIDDYYSPERIAKQIEALEKGCQLVSSNFQRINDKGENIGDPTDFHTKEFLREADLGHNIIAHPVIAMTAAFWKRYRHYDEAGFRAAREAGTPPTEDFEMWKNAAVHNENICVLPDVLLYHRVHGNNTGKGTPK